MKLCDVFLVVMVTSMYAASKTMLSKQGHHHASGALRGTTLRQRFAGRIDRFHGLMCSRCSLSSPPSAARLVVIGDAALLLGVDGTDAYTLVHSWLVDTGSCAAAVACVHVSVGALLF